MKLLNIRRGFATNSSSTHSIIVYNGKDSRDHDEFGWQEFICSSKEAKTSYFAQSLYASMPYKMDESRQIQIIKDTFPNYQGECGGYVDHQSLFRCPQYLNGQLATDFYKAFADHIINNDTLSIVGGNDNEDSYTFGDYEQFHSYIETDTDYFIRKEQYG